MKPLVDCWERWDRRGVAHKRSSSDPAPEYRELRVYVRRGLGPDLFGAHILELGMRVVAPLWGLFADEATA